jgi:hypothetical protein
MLAPTIFFNFLSDHIKTENNNKKINNKKNKHKRMHRRILTVDKHVIKIGSVYQWLSGDETHEDMLGNENDKVTLCDSLFKAFKR